MACLLLVFSIPIELTWAAGGDVLAQFDLAGPAIGPVPAFNGFDLQRRIAKMQPKVVAGVATSAEAFLFEVADAGRKVMERDTTTLLIVSLPLVAIEPHDKETQSIHMISGDRPQLKPG